MIKLMLKQELTISARNLAEAEALYKTHLSQTPIGIKIQLTEDEITHSGTEEFDLPPADSASHKYKNVKAASQIARLEVGGASYDKRHVISTSVPPLKELNKPDFEPGQDLF